MFSYSPDVTKPSMETLLIVLFPDVEETEVLIELRDDINIRNVIRVKNTCDLFNVITNP